MTNWKWQTALLATLAAGTAIPQAALAQEPLREADEYHAALILKAAEAQFARYEADFEEAVALRKAGKCEDRESKLNRLQGEIEGLEAPAGAIMRSEMDQSGFTDRFAAELAQPCEPQKSESKISITAGATTTWAEFPGTGTGFQRDGAPGTAPEDFAVESPKDTTLYGGYVNLDYGKARLYGKYSEGDNSASAAIPGGLDSGIVYGELSPGRSSGIAASNGLTATIEEELEHFGIGAAYELFILNHFPPLVNVDCTEILETRTDRCPGWGRELTVNSYFEYSRTERDIYTSAEYAGIAGGGFVASFSQTRDQRIRDDNYELGTGVKASWKTTSGIGFGVDATAGGYRYESDLDSVEVNRNNFTGPPDGEFTVTIRDDDGGWGFHGGAGAFVSYDIAENVAIGVRGAYDYRSDVGTVFNPSSGDQVFFDGLTTALDHDSAEFWTGSVFVAVSIP